MDIASGAFYTSGTFWAGAGTVAGVLGTVAVVWVTLTVGLPRRRLFYWLRSSAPLLTAPQGMRSGLELRRRRKPGDESPGEPDGPDGWQVLADPRVVTIDLTSRGRSDIPSDAFNDRQPLQFDTGAPIVEILQATASQAGRPAPPVTADGTLLNIGPGLIGKRQGITITVLTDGGDPSLTLHRDPFVNVQVRQRSQESSSAAAEWARVATVLATALAFVLTWPLSFAGVVAATGVSRAWALVAVLTVMVTVAAALWAWAARRNAGR